MGRDGGNGKGEGGLLVRVVMGSVGFVKDRMG